MANCMSCTGPTTCASCANGYFFTNGTCTFVTLNCVSYNSATNTCMGCSNMYYIKNGQCYRCPYECQSCNSLSNCQTCMPGYFLNQSGGVSTGECVSCTPPCLTCYNNGTQCTTCRSGYQLSSMFTCTPCSTGCLACDHVAYCLLCQPAYVKVNYTTLGGQQLFYCLQCPANCATCQTTQLANGTVGAQCTKCVFGYTQTTNGSCFGCGSTE